MPTKIDIGPVYTVDPRQRAKYAKGGCGRLFGTSRLLPLPAAWLWGEGADGPSSKAGALAPADRLRRCRRPQTSALCSASWCLTWTSLTTTTCAPAAAGATSAAAAGERRARVVAPVRDTER